MDNLERKAKTFRLPLKSTPEDLATSWLHVIRFGSFTLLAGYYYMGLKPCWFGAVYVFSGSGAEVDSPVDLLYLSNVEFFDEGHAIQWCLDQI